MSDTPFLSAGQDLMTQEEVCVLLGVNPASIRDYMRGHLGKPPLPFARVGKLPFYSRILTARWMQQIQEGVDPKMVDVKRARREQGTQ